MADPSCSHWWHAPLYVSVSLILAFTAISSTKNSKPELPDSGFGLAFNASRALRVRGGFQIFATLLHISPELFLSSHETTVFAIQDSALSHLSIPPWVMRRLLRSHAVSSSLPMSELFHNPLGSCFKTLEDNKNLVITNRDINMGSVMINNMPISHPDMFLEGHLTVHGVLGPFDFLTPYCNSSDIMNRPILSNGTHQAIDWTRIIRLLSSNGFVSFAIGLNSVADGFLPDSNNLSSVTVFATPDPGYMASSPSPILDRFVRLHITPQRFAYMQLTAYENSSLKTLSPGFDLKIGKSSGTLAVNGVEITAPDMSLSEKFAIHGLSREFDMDPLFSSFL